MFGDTQPIRPRQLWAAVTRVVEAPLRDQSPAVTTMDDQRPHAERRGSRVSYIAVAAAVLAFAAAAIAAIGPAEHERSVFVWPPRQLPSQTPQHAWYTPLLLANRVPASIDVTLSCSLPSALPGAESPHTVLATARNPEWAEALRIERARSSLLVSVGNRRLATVSWPPAPSQCPYVIRVADGELITPETRVRASSTFPDGMPTVSSLFSQLDLRAARALNVRVTTRTYATSPTDRQVVAAAVAVLSVLAVLLLLGFGLIRTVRRFIGGPLRPLAAAGPVDAVVVGFLVAWWVLSPAFGDDGYVWIRVGQYANLGAFSNYHDSYGANLPLDYWLEWLLHWLVGATDDLVILRLPSLVALVASWFIARWSLRRALGSVEPRAARWALATAFVVLAMAWGMTLRPEPFVCLLVATNLAAALSFAVAPSLGSLAVIALASSLALTAHPAGIVALAPVLAIGGPLYRSLRKRAISRAGAGALALASLALTVLLTFVDRDLGSWNDDRELFEHSGYYSQPWWQEWDRYTGLMKISSWSASVRQMSVALLLLALLAYATRRRFTGERRILAIPTHTLAIALCLFVLTPSKHQWHFGTLMAVGAVAIAIESTRFLGDGRTSPNRRLRPFIALELVIAAFLWSWMMNIPWTLLDLQTLTWEQAFGAINVRGSAFLTWLLLILVLVAAAAVFERFRSRRGRPLAPDLPWRLVVWGFQLCALVLIVATVTVLGVDTAQAREWAPVRQNVAALVGRAGCGLGDHLRVDSVPASRESIAAGRGLAPVLSTTMNETGPTLVDHLLAPYFPCADLPFIAGGLIETPRLIISRSGWIRPIWVRESAFAGVTDLYSVRFLYGNDALSVFSVDDAIPGLSLAPAERVRGGS